MRNQENEQENNQENPYNLKPGETYDDRVFRLHIDSLVQDPDFGYESVDVVLALLEIGHTNLHEHQFRPAFRVLTLLNMIQHMSRKKLEIALAH